MKKQILSPCSVNAAKYWNERVRETLKKRGYTQKKFADELEKSMGHILHKR